MSDLGVGVSASPDVLVATPRRTEDPAKVRDAAQQFEALLLGQILKSARESDGGWGGAASSDCISDFASQQLATALAKEGGIGLADLVSKGLEGR